MPSDLRSRQITPSRRGPAGRLLPLLLLATVAGLGPALANDAPSLDALLAPSFPSQMVAASGAARLAWVGNDQGRRNVWCALPDGDDSWTSSQLTSFTEDDGQEITNLAFDSAASHLLWVRGGPPNRAGELPNPTSDPDGAERAIWLLELDDCTARGPARKVATGASPRFLEREVDDSAKTSVLYQSSGKVFAVDLPGSSSRRRKKQKESAPKPRALISARGGIGDLTPSPDGSRIAFVSDRGTHALIGVFDLAEGSVRWLDPGVDRDGSPIWSPDGSQIAFLRLPTRVGVPFLFTPEREGPPWSIRVADVTSGEGREVWRAQQGRGSVFRNIVGAKQLVWTATDQIVFPWEGDGWTHLYSVRAARDHASASAGDLARPLTPGDFEIEYVAPVRTGDGGTLGVVYSSNQDDIDRRHLWFVDGEGRRKRLTRGNGVENVPVPLQASADGDFELAYVGASGRLPLQPRVLTTGTDGDARSPARDLWPEALADYPTGALVEPQQVVFAASDGLEIHGQLFVPHDSAEPPQRKPAMLFLHGGSRRHMMLGFHYSSYYHNTYTFNQYLASRGFVVLSVNYRSGIGYGMEFREALDYGAAGASELRDVLGAALYLRTRDDVDPDRIGLYGGSYGGYLTAMGLTRASDLFAVGVDIHGVHDWNRTIQGFIPAYDPLEKPERTRLAFESSPLSQVEDWRSPVLLIHGDDDRNVPFAETAELVQKLREVGTEFELLVLPDEVHGFLRHASWLEVFERSADFVVRHLASPTSKAN